MLEEKIKVKRIRNDLDKFEMNKLGAKINAEIEILEKKQNKNRARKIIKNIEKSKLKLREMETMKTPNILANMLVEEIKGIHTRYGRKFKISD